MEETSLDMKQKLLDKIASKEIVVGVVGMGYVGLPLAVEKAKAGFKTIGFDVQTEKVRFVNEGHNYIGDVVDQDLKQLVEAGTLSATADFSFIKEVDFVAMDENGVTYFQVAASVRDEKTLFRELASLQKINDNYPKYILSLDDDPEADYSGIRRINALDWLFGSQCYM